MLVEAEIKRRDQPERRRCWNESLDTADTMFHSGVKKQSFFGHLMHLWWVALRSEWASSLRVQFVSGPLASAHPHGPLFCWECESLPTNNKVISMCLCAPDEAKPLLKRVRAHTHAIKSLANENFVEIIGVEDYLFWVSKNPLFLDCVIARVWQHHEIHATPLRRFDHK